MHTKAKDVFDSRWIDVRKKYISDKIRDKRLVKYWLKVKGEEAALQAEKEVREIMKQDRFKISMSRQSGFEMQILKDIREEE